MIRDLPITIEIEQALLKKFSGWMPYFPKKLRNEGIQSLVDEYEKAVKIVESYVCTCFFGKRPVYTREDGKHVCGIQYEDYTNDMTVREALQFLIDLIPPDDFRPFAVQIDRLDERLFKMCDHPGKRKRLWWKTAVPRTVYNPED